VKLKSPEMKETNTYGATTEKIENVMRAMGMKATIKIVITDEVGA
jgi:hypothetical protein